MARDNSPSTAAGFVDTAVTPVGTSTSPADVASPLGATLSSGTVIGERYAIVRLLGRGGMGAVYEALQRPIGRRVALKVLNPMYSDDPGAVQRFLAEARLANQVRHRNVVQVTDFGEHHGRPFLVMELLEGEALAEVMEREGPMDPESAVAMLAPVFRAMDYAHSQGVVHRDIKPDNLFMARDPGSERVEARVLDLGVAVAFGDDAKRITATGAVLGTPSYMAPEQVLSSRTVTGRADQYALGCVLYEMLTGRLPVESESLHGLLLAKTTTDPVDIRSHRPDLPESTASAVMRSVARDPNARFTDLAAMLAELAELAELEPTAPTREPVAPPVALPPRLATVPIAATVARGHGPLWPFALVALAVLGTVLVALSRRAPTVVAPPLRGALPAVVPAPVAPLVPIAIAPAPVAPVATSPASPRHRSAHPEVPPRRPRGPRMSIDTTNPLRGH